MKDNVEKFELLYQGYSELLKINATKGDIFKVESGSMMGMTPTFERKSNIGNTGTMLSGVMSEYKATSDGELLITPKDMGNIMKIEMDGGRQYRISNGRFLACTEGINIETKSKTKSKGIFGSGEGLFAARVVGEGTLFLNLYGVLHKISLDLDEEYIVDSDHLVIWDNDMEFTRKMPKKELSNSLFSGEYTSVKFTGPGEIWMQTRKALAVSTGA